MTPKQQRLKNLHKSRTIVKTKRIVFGTIYLTVAILAIYFILGAL
jgi:hypothetical protein